MSSTDNNHDPDDSLLLNDDKNDKGLQRSNMDFTIAPCDNFFLYANGSWMKNNPIPAEYPSWNTFMELFVKSQEQTRTICEGLLEKNTADDEKNSEEESKLGAFYAAGMNEEAIEQHGIAPLEPLLELIEQTVEAATQSSGEKLAGKLGEFQWYGVSPFFSIGTSPDNKNSDHTICQISQGGIGLPDRDYYFDQDKQDKRDAYKKHVAKMLYLLDQYNNNIFIKEDDDDADQAESNQQQEEKEAETTTTTTTQQEQEQEQEEDKEENNNNDIPNQQQQQESKEEEKDNDGIPAVYHDMASTIYTVEETLAKAHMTKTENRDPHATYNKMSLLGGSSFDETERTAGAVANDDDDDDADESEAFQLSFDTTICKEEELFHVESFFQSATKLTPKQVGDINVRNVHALESAIHVIVTIEPDILRNYLKWNVLRKTAKYLPKEFEEEQFDFFSRILTGTKEMKPRWKRVMETVESALGEALGKLYCDQYFDQSCKTKALEIVENVRQALEDRLQEVDWMKSQETRDQALKKMNKFKVKIGFPDEWIDYTNMAIKPEQSYLEMIFESSRFHHQRSVKEMNQPTNRQKWFMTPQTVNAYYHPSLNEIVFPAAILQPPFFMPLADDAVNYGAMGAVIGHEMTHGFDDQGRKFNFEGNMHDWWTKEDGDEYESRVQVMVNQANQFTVYDQTVQGKLTSGENIADLGGLRLALRALLKQDATTSSNKKLINGFTPTQRFFLAWAQAWRQNITKERALQLLTLDPHGPNEMRCNSPLSNIQEFHEAFCIPTNAPMYKPLEQRVDIW